MPLGLVGSPFDLLVCTLPMRAYGTAVRSYRETNTQVGSVLETEEERGVAHLIEHLAFRASRTCPQEFDLVKEASSDPLFHVAAT